MIAINKINSIFCLRTSYYTPFYIWKPLLQYTILCVISPPVHHGTGISILIQDMLVICHPLPI